MWSPKTEEEWLPPWATPEWLEWWKSLDHTMCTQAGYDPDSEVPAYIRCMSMHCPKCNRTTGGQGHFNCTLKPI